MSTTTKSTRSSTSTSGLQRALKHFDDFVEGFAAYTTESYDERVVCFIGLFALSALLVFSPHPEGLVSCVLVTPLLTLVLYTTVSYFAKSLAARIEDNASTKVPAGNTAGNTATGDRAQTKETPRSAPELHTPVARPVARRTRPSASLTPSPPRRIRGLKRVHSTGSMARIPESRHPPRPLHRTPSPPRMHDKSPLAIMRAASEPTKLSMDQVADNEIVQLLEEGRKSTALEEGRKSTVRFLAVGEPSPSLDRHWLLEEGRKSTVRFLDDEDDGEPSPERRRPARSSTAPTTNPPCNRIRPTTPSPLEPKPTRMIKRNCVRIVLPSPTSDDEQEEAGTSLTQHGADSDAESRSSPEDEESRRKQCGEGDETHAEADTCAKVANVQADADKGPVDPKKKKSVESSAPEKKKKGMTNINSKSTPSLLLSGAGDGERGVVTVSHNPAARKSDPDAVNHMARVEEALAKLPTTTRKGHDVSKIFRYLQTGLLHNIMQREQVKTIMKHKHIFSNKQSAQLCVLAIRNGMLEPGEAPSNARGGDDAARDPPRLPSSPAKRKRQYRLQPVIPNPQRARRFPSNKKSRGGFRRRGGLRRGIQQVNSSPSLRHMGLQMQNQNRPSSPFQQRFDNTPPLNRPFQNPSRAWRRTNSSDNLMTTRIRRTPLSATATEFSPSQNHEHRGAWRPRRSGIRPIHPRN